ncbi:MAG: Hint domain-containing protein [Candidatus Babeliales bacterium]
MKIHHFLLLLFIWPLFFSQVPIVGHGFGASTLVRTSSDARVPIKQLCQKAVKKNCTVLSRALHARSNKKHAVTAAGQSETNWYVRFGFDAHETADICCTPTQEFYVPALRKWVPAYQLKKGDSLLTLLHAGNPIAHIRLIKEPLPVYAIQVKKTHVYFVGEHDICTHNMLFPLFFNIGIGTSFGAGAAAGGAAGGCFGPISVLGGVVAGGLIGVAVKCFSDKIPQYNLLFNSNALAHYFDQTEIEQPPVELPSQPQQVPEEKPKKTVEDLQKEAGLIEEKRFADIYKKPGGFGEAVKDFESLGLRNVKDLSNDKIKKKVGQLPDGRMINVRNDSSQDKLPTLEIQNPKRKSIKIRYY